MYDEAHADYSDATRIPEICSDLIESGIARAGLRCITASQTRRTANIGKSDRPPERRHLNEPSHAAHGQCLRGGCGDRRGSPGVEQPILARWRTVRFQAGNLESRRSQAAPMSSSARRWRAPIVTRRGARPSRRSTLRRRKRMGLDRTYPQDDSSQIGCAGSFIRANAFSSLSCGNRDVELSVRSRRPALEHGFQRSPNPSEQSPHISADALAMLDPGAIIHLVNHGGPLLWTGGGPEGDADLRRRLPTKGSTCLIKRLYQAPCDGYPRFLQFGHLKRSRARARLRRPPPNWG